MIQIVQVVSLINFFFALLAMIGCFVFISTYTTIFAGLLFSISIYLGKNDAEGYRGLNGTIMVNSLSIFIGIWKLYF
jgi:hypothetical protein